MNFIINNILLQMEYTPDESIKVSNSGCGLQKDLEFWGYDGDGPVICDSTNIIGPSPSDAESVIVC